MDNKSIQFETPIGIIRATANETLLLSIEFLDKKIDNTTSKKKDTNNICNETKKQILEYFAGKRKNFDIPIAPKGTDFQKKVWKALTKIPYAKTETYISIAKKIKHPKAYRAVGNANNKNPLPIIIPCHRVIRKTGALGGYASGVSVKEKLLLLENKYAQDSPN